MRSRLVPRALAGLVLAGSLAACGLPGGDPGESAFLVGHPSAVFVDLPDEGTGSDTFTITFTNLGPATALSVGISTVVVTSDDPQALDDISFSVSCPTDLEAFDSCEVDGTFIGRVPEGDYTATVSMEGDNTNEATVDLVFV